MFDVNEMGGGEATAERGTKDTDVAQSLYISALHYYADTVVLQSRFRLASAGQHSHCGPMLDFLLQQRNI